MVFNDQRHTEVCPSCPERCYTYVSWWFDKTQQRWGTVVYVLEPTADAGSGRSASSLDAINNLRLSWCHREISLSDVMFYVSIAVAAARAELVARRWFDRRRCRRLQYDANLHYMICRFHINVSSSQLSHFLLSRQLSTLCNLTSNFREPNFIILYILNKLS